MPTGVYKHKPPSKETREKLRRASTGRKHSLATREKLSKMFKGKPLSEKHRLAFSKAAKHKWRDPSYRKRYSEEISPKRLTPEVRYKIGAPWRGKKMPAYLHKKLSIIANTPEKIKSSREGRMKQQFTKTSKAEFIFGRFLWWLKVPFDFHSRFGRFQPDFIFPLYKLVVQLDGEYWHRICSFNNDRDTKFNKYAREQGWKVIRLSSEQTTKNLGAAINYVLKNF